MADDRLQIYLGPALADYGFEEGHPFHLQRHEAFERAFDDRGLRGRCVVREPVRGSEADLLIYHTPEHVARVKALSGLGHGSLDGGDTPARKGIYEAACTVVGSTLDAARHIVSGKFQRAFIPIAGLHHARRGAAAGFCVFNDCGVAIEYLKGEGVERIAYVDIDVHHGDGVFYDFEDDPRVIFADVHQDGRTLYPGTGFIDESGLGAAAGLKLNVPLPPYSDDRIFMGIWSAVEEHVELHQPQIILLQCGADSLAGDPIASLAYTAASHAHAAKQLRALAQRCCGGRMLALGGGGYNTKNIADAWTAVVEQLV